ncbi:MAG: transposase [Bacteroidota bacterium]
MIKKGRNSHQNSSYPQVIKKVFSESLKRKKVRDLDLGLISPSELSRQLDVSLSSIYVWKKKYSMNYQKQVQVVVEEKSLTMKSKQLKEEIKLLRERLGEKQIENELYKEMLDLIAQDYGIDIDEKYYKKKPFSHLSKNERK